MAAPPGRGPDGPSALLDPSAIQAMAAFCADKARVAIQLDDAHLGEAMALVRRLQPRCPGCALFVLGDTSHSPCCADEVAAMHAQAEAIVHVGPTCLSSPSQLPVLVVTAEPEPPSLDAVDVSILPPVLAGVLCDPQAHKLAASLVRDKLPHLDLPLAPPKVLEVSLSRPPPPELPPGAVLFVGRSGPRIDEVAMSGRQVFLLDSSSLVLSEYTPATSKSLARRMFLVEKAKTARIIGIVVGTLSTAGYARAVDRLRKVVVEAGLKPYVFLMGKLNAAKLGNFPHVDAFVLVACPLTQATDSRDFPRPVLTPFELECALSQRPFTPRTAGAADFAALLEEPLFPPPDEPVFSSFDGSLRKLNHEGKHLALVYSSPAADALATRSFRGLDARNDAEEAPKAAAARSGLSGVASRLVKEDGGVI